MDKLDSIIQLFLEEPDNSLILVPNVGTQAKLLMRMASVHYKRLISQGEEFRVMDHPNTTRILITDAWLLDPSLIVWLKHRYNVVLIEEGEEVVQYS